MNAFQLKFLYNNQYYIAQVQQTGNLYHVTPQDAALEQTFGEATLLEANGDFAWQNYGPEYYSYVLSVANALKKHLGFPE
jgi:hypothetical protein